ncbi:helix-turn-helix domain-containing protein [Mucilaginibacter terrae]|uniref:helix-turn-helix domain-containing protein n=1 Tax=Mucilaginibacter terrae TaxID=1955052 RepID=UPI00362D236E
MSALGHYIRELRKEKEETLHQVSKGTDIDSPLLSKIERGDRLPTNEQIVRIAKYYNVAEGDLKAQQTAEKILKEYGVNETTFQAIQLVSEELKAYANTGKQRSHETKS